MYELDIFLSCGEPSGDHYAGRLISGLLALYPETKIQGMMGMEGRDAGGDPLWDISELGLMGISDVIHSLPRLFRLKSSITRYVMEKDIPMVIVIDAPDFHLPLIRSLRDQGYSGKIIYISPPTVWAWRKGRAKVLKNTVDLCLPLFPFEDRALKELGVQSRWMGHPFVDEFMGSFDMCHVPQWKSSAKRIAILPGSRRGEINRLLPVFIEAAEELRASGMIPVFSVAPFLEDDIRTSVLEQLKGFESYQGSARELMFSSDLVLGASGTAAVEAMMLGRFMIVAYKGSLSSYIVYRTMVKTEFISIPNILSGEKVFPELIQKDVTVSRILQETDHYLKDRQFASRVRELTLLGKQRMGDPGAVGFWIRCILEHLP